MAVRKTGKQYIKIRGANENNLKNLDVDIPRDEFVVLMIGDCRELGNLLRAVAQGLVEEQLLILKHADFRGGGAGVNHQNFVRHDCFLLNYYDSLILSICPKTLSHLLYSRTFPL